MYNAYDKNLKLSTHERHLRVIFLANEKDEKGNLLSDSIIAYLTGYVERTIRTYKHKFADLLEEAKKLFFGKVKHILNKVEETFEIGTELCYLCKCYDGEGILVFSKIGTTKRDILTRMKEHLNYYSNVWVIEIESIVNCGKYPAEGLESYCRAYFIKEYPNNFHKNDRFFNVDLNTEEFNNLATTYLA